MDRIVDDFMAVLKVNVGGTFLCKKEGSKLMVDNQVNGIQINIGSVYGKVSSDPRIYTDSLRMNSEVYSASKAAIIKIIKSFFSTLSKAQY